MTAVAAGLLAVLGAGIAFKERAREQWYIWRLGSGDPVERDRAAGELAGMKSRRAIPVLRELGAWNEVFEIAGIGYKRLGHASVALDLEGMDRDGVAAILGAPDAALRCDFHPPAYRRPDPLPAFSEQWIYYHPSKLSCIFIYLDGGRVVLAVEEWSDF